MAARWLLTQLLRCIARALECAPHADAPLLLLARAISGARALSLP